MLLRKIKENRIAVNIIIIAIVGCILFVPMFRENNDIYLDDGSQHLMRAYYTYKSIVENGTANVISDFANGFGYSWNLFYGPLSTYLIILVSIVFGSFNLGFKIAFLLILIIAGIFMHKLIYEVTDNQNTALLGAIIYMTSPYFFNDIYIRHAIRRMPYICVVTYGIFGALSFI